MNSSFDRTDLPVTCAYWPVVPDDPLDGSGPLDAELRDVAEVVCGDEVNWFVCTRDPGHERPHVAAALVTVAAVWDDDWFADSLGTNCPTREVERQ